MQYIKYFDVVITSDKVDKPKPSPDSINLIVDEFNLDRSETIYIGDSESDSVALKNAEVLFGFASWENKNNIGYYDYLFESPKDIFSLCNDINKVN